MNKGTIIGLIMAVIVIIVAVAGFAICRNSSNSVNNNQASDTNEQKNAEVIANTEENNNENAVSSGSKILVVYYSAQSHTSKVANRIANNLNADIFEIVPEEVYSDADLIWTDSNSRVSKEHDDESLRNIKLKSTEVPNWDNYDTVLIGYPIWWGIAAWPTDTFVKANDFTGKTVIPFCTSYSSGLGQSGKLLQDKANGGTWQTGQRFQQDAKDSDVDKWTNGLDL